jgi:hypothetical protein
MAASLGVKSLEAIRELRHEQWTDTVKTCYQEMTSEDIEDFMCAAVTVIFRVCKPLRLS